MPKFIHRDRIVEKLEIARTIGLLTDYVVEPTDQSHRREASVRVSRSPNVSDEAVKDYLIRLLQGFVLDHQIVVMAPFEAVDTAPSAAAGERIEPAPTLPVPVAA
jgi:hypothetical protein